MVQPRPAVVDDSLKDDSGLFESDVSPCLSFNRTLMERMIEFQQWIVSNCLNTNIYSYLEPSVGQSSNLYLNIVHFFNAHLN